MPDTDRLYALSSTYTNPWWSNDTGPGLLIHDAVLAMRWYLSNEREERLAVTGHVSDDGGATWRPLHTGELLADAEQALQHAEQAGGAASRTAALLREAMAAEAASWLDGRIRYVQPDDPAPHRPPRPDLPAWERGGQIWALALSSVPPDAVLAHLAARYASPQPDGPEYLRTGAQHTLSALALANDPAGADVHDLLGALDHLNELAFGFEMGQLRTLAEDAQRNLADHLVSRLPLAAAPTGLTTEHPVQQVTRADIDRLAGPEGMEGLRVGARDALTEALARATGQAAAEDTVGSGGRAAVPGYPRHLPSEQQAAAQWRAISPVARRAAEQAMSQLVEAVTTLTEATASGAAVQRDDSARIGLEQLNARHALLMHAMVLADAEAAAVPAAHEAVVAAAQATAARAGSPTEGEAMTEEAGFMARVNTAQDRIAETLTKQQQVTSDALHRLFMYPISSSELHLMRTQLIDDSGLGLDAYNQAYRTLSEASGYLQQLEDGHHPKAPPGQVAEARTRVRQAEAEFTDLQLSRTVTLRAVTALDGVAGIAPSSKSAAARAAEIVAQSRERALQGAPLGASRHSRASTDQARQAANLQSPPSAPGHLR